MDWINMGYEKIIQRQNEVINLEERTMINVEVCLHGKLIKSVWKNKIKGVGTFSKS